MKSFETLTAGGRDYNLKFTALNAVTLEGKLGFDLVSGLEKITSISTLAEYYYSAMQAMNDIGSLNDVYTIFDDYILGGGTYDALQKLMIDTLVVSGIISAEVNDTSKKIMEKQKAALEKLSI